MQAASTVDDVVLELLQEANPTDLLSDRFQDLSQPLECSVVGSHCKSLTLQVMLEILHEINHRQKFLAHHAVICLTLQQLPACISNDSFGVLL